MSFLFPKKIKKILITGGLGFIGSNLIRKILLESDITIYNLDKVSYCSDDSCINLALKNIKESKERYNFLKLDLCNFNSLRKLISDIEPDLVIHLAAESHVDRSIENPISFIENNILGTLNLLEATRKFWSKLNNKKKHNFRFHHISTDEVFGTVFQSNKFNEKTRFDPRSPYSASKASSDHLVQAWYHTYELPISISNCSNNYGPWQFPEKLIPLTIYNALNGNNINLYGDGSNIRDWIFIEDHLDGLLSAALYGVAGESYCIGSNNEISNRDIVEKICDILDQRIASEINCRSLIKYVEDRPGHDKHYAINSSKIINHLNWRPKYDFELGISKTIDWYLVNQKWVEKILKKSNYKGHRLGIYY